MEPRVSIGMPAYNSAGTIASAIESLLAQTFGDFELIVSDNASTDHTQEVVRELARLDARIKFQRQAINVGANPNYTAVFRPARGEYFKWASSSDWTAPRFLERCIASLEAHPDATVAAPRTRLFTTDPAQFQEYQFDLEILDPSPAIRLYRFRNEMRLNNALNGLMRTSAVRATRVIEPYFAADVVLMGHLMLLGKLVRVEEPLYYRRMEPTTATALQGMEAIRKHHYPRMSTRALFQGCKRYAGWLHIAAAAPLSARERYRVYRQLARMALGDRQVFVEDVRDALRYAFGALGRRSPSAR